MTVALRESRKTLTAALSETSADVARWCSVSAGVYCTDNLKVWRCLLFIVEVKVKQFIQVDLLSLR